VRKQLIAAGVAAAALGVSAGQALGAGGTRSCGNVSPTVGNIKATKTSCKVAKKVTRATSKGKKYDDWKCHSKRINTGAQVTCTHKGGKKVTYQLAD
jgi:endonuclease YncB( thermonuclease family)